MAAITVHSIAHFFKDDSRLILRGENALKSNHVLAVNYDGDCKRFSGKVHASMKDKAYSVEIFLNDDGLVQEAKCNCPRGRLQCHHMAAVMVYGNRNISSTSVSCKWSAAKKKTNAKVTTILDLYPPVKPYTAIVGHVTDDDIKYFHKQLSARVGRHVGFSWLLLPEPEPSSRKVKTVEDVLTSKEFLYSNKKSGFLLEQLEVSQSEIELIENATKKQSECALWYMYRKGRLTASNFGVALKAVENNKYPLSLFKRLLGEYDLNGLKSTQWGKDHESVAIEAFTRSTGLVVHDTGFWLHITGVLGATPDGLVCKNAIVEVKCPFINRNETVEYCIDNDKNFVLQRNSEGNIEISKSHQYYHQIQGQLHLTKRDICFLCLWTLKNMVIIQVDKDPLWGQQNIPKLIDFYVNMIVPKLIAGGC